MNPFNLGLFTKLALLGALLVTGCKMPPDRTPSEVFELDCPRDLSREECEVHDRFARTLSENPEEAIWRYRQHFGNVINTDSARELSEDYAPDGLEATTRAARAGRTRWSDATSQPATILSREIYRRILAADTVVFTAGGSGSGKSTAIRTIPSLAQILNNAFLIYDTTLSRGAASRESVAQALDAGKRVQIIYVYREPVDALVNGALPRAMENGRTLTIREFAQTHVGAIRVLNELQREYRDDRRFEITVVDNSRGLGNAEIVNDTESFLSSRAASQQNLERQLEQALRRERRFRLGRRRISRQVYEAFLGE